MDRLTIALISDWFAPRVGGVELHMQDLARALRGRGHEVRVLTTAAGPPDFEGIPVHRFRVPMWEGLGVAVPNLLRIPIAVRAIRAIRPDVIHAHGMFSVAAISGLIAARHLGIPSVSTHHSLLRGGQRWGARAVFAVFSYRADLLTAVSEAAAADARRASGRTLVALLPNGIHPSEWPLARSQPGEVHIVSVMRLVAQKSPQALIRALPAVLGRVPATPPVRVTVIGDGPERAALERLVAGLGLRCCVTLTGELPREQVRGILGTASVFALPGRLEAFGIAVLEARCAGLPIVAMREGGIPEIVEHGRQGLLAHSEDEFAEFLTRIVTDEPLRTRMGHAAKEGVGDFAWERVVEQHLATYRDVIAGHRVGRPQRRAA